MTGKMSGDPIALAALTATIREYVAQRDAALAQAAARVGEIAALTIERDGAIAALRDCEKRLSLAELGATRNAAGGDGQP